jgi:dTDP-4-amino-4,6-dideoxygalactose transaminase
LHPYYQETFGYRPEDFPNATQLFQRTISLPLFPAMTEREIEHVIATVIKTVGRYAVPVGRARTA